MEQEIQNIRNIIQFYEQFANQPEWFIDEREHSITISLTSFADTATKLDNSDNYKPTDEEQNYWNYMIDETEKFADKLFGNIQDPHEYYERSFWDLPLRLSIAKLYREFNGRVCENGEKLECVREELD
jgi:hypothetical protein